MSVYFEDKDRKIIPRWRSFQTTLALRELSPLREERRIPEFPEEFFAAKIEDWKKSQTFSYAADLLSSAIVLGRVPEAHDAAQYVFESGKSQFKAAKRLAQSILGLRQTRVEQILEPGDAEIGRMRQDAHKLRLKIKEEPRDVFLWVDLALLYESFGLPKQSERAMTIALRLAPENRFVLRSAARLYVHQDKFYRAHELLIKSQRLKKDPWLLSAEIATASIVRRTSRFVKTARNILKSQSYSPYHLSELGSAVGTLELEAGKVKWARNSLRLSLEDPTENAIAQASWLTRHTSAPGLADCLERSGPKSYEALGRSYYYECNWKQAVAAAEKWHSDQPFSSRPPIFGSYIAATAMQDFKGSAKIAAAGLVANPHSITLLNNYAYAAAQADLVNNAQEAFARIYPRDLTEDEMIFWSATKGLLHYRTGRPSDGRQSYLDAIDRARTRGDTQRCAIASICFALEELRAGTTDAQKYRAKALEAAKNVQLSEIRPLIKRLEKYK